MAKGLQAQNTDVEFVFVFSGADNLPGKSGYFDGVKYRYLAGNKSYRSIFGKVLRYTCGIITGFWYLSTKRVDPHYRVIACYHGVYSGLLWAFCNKLGIIVVRELNEYSVSIIRKGIEGQSALDIIRDQMTLKHFKGFIFISTRLADYYHRMFPTMPYIVVPINVDSERFSQLKLINHRDSVYITYVGALSVYKDGVDILIRSFACLLRKYPNLRLKLIGKEPTQNDRYLIGKQIEDLQIRDCIDFVGYLERDKALEELSDSKILALARPDTIQGRGGMPTKLGEYLATGIPLVCTSVGDVDKYFTDGFNLILARPGSVNDFTQKLQWVIENYDQAVSVAARGKELVSTVFSNHRQAKIIIDYLESLGR